jgi:sugar phosphate isomerase/epimerase
MMQDQKPTNASLSTMWAIHNFQDLNEFFQISKQLGFGSVELNHQLDSSMLSGIKWDHVQLSSVHEPCPADIPTKQLAERDWLISSPDQASRAEGMEGVKRSIRLAKEIGAATVVVHCGTIPSKSSHEAMLRYFFETGKFQSGEYQAIKNQIVQERENGKKRRLKAVKESLHELLDYANGFEIKLGLENRYHYLDLPSLDEMEELLSLGGPDVLGFIYDVGHAQALDRLGFYPREEWLRRYSNRMLGTHLHDVIGLTDHYAPGLGEIDFRAIAGYLPENAFRTFEILPGNTLAQVKRGINLLVNTGCIRYI